MRRLALAAIVLATALLTACGGSDEAAEAPAAEPDAAASPAPAEPAATEPAAAEPATATTTAQPATAECSREDFPSQGANHVEGLPSDFEYNSFPATSGPHAASWVIWNPYTDPLPELNLVHNLEHGGIVVQFGPGVPEADLQAVSEWYIEDPVALILAPLPELGDRIAATAWTHLLTCDGFDEEAFTAFRDEFRFNGPEAIPPGNLQPGM
jgi:hypothetical protein